VENLTRVTTFFVRSSLNEREAELVEKGELFARTREVVSAGASLTQRLFSGYFKV
jgi:hypothetical protein